MTEPPRRVGAFKMTTHDGRGPKGPPAGIGLVEWALVAIVTIGLVAIIGIAFSALRF